MNEIITFGTKYNLNPGIKVFVKSAIRFNTKVTVIDLNLTEEIRSFLTQEGVNIVDGNAIAADYNVDTNISPYTLKVIFFYLYCKHYCKSINTYFCDFTDVYFQKDVFELITNKNTYTSSENKLINTCETNTTWIKICYNNDILNLLSKKEILNSGSILGTRESCLETLKEMCLDMTQIISRIGNYQVIDQASLNKVAHFDSFKYNILNNFEIFNLAHYGNAQLGVRDKLITLNNYQPYIIHQYDVIKNLEQQLYDKFAK
jgi:hypothetical protein